MRYSIRYQLLIPLLFLLLGVLGVSSWLIMSASRQAVEQQLEEQLRQVARTLAEAHYAPNDRILQQMKFLSGADFVFVSHLEGTLSTVPSPPSELKELPVFDAWQELRLGPVLRVGSTPYRVSSLRLKSDEDDGWQRGVVHILYPEERLETTLLRPLRLALLLTAAGGLVCVGIALFLAQRLTYRLLDLERRTRLIAIGDFSPMPLPTWNDEIRDLTRSVNNMAQQLQGMQETIKQTERLQLLGQVAGGLAHQLRNAATGARLAVQVYVGELQHPSDREPLEIALRQLGLIEERLQRFLQLGRAEEPERSLVELRTLMGEVAALLRPNCQHLKVHLRMPEHPASANVLADAEQLRQVLINVLTNAIEAVGSGGLVEIHWSVNESTVTLEISDNGPGPDPKIASRLFEPFVTGKTEGIGLGLAVVKHTVERHGGTVTWERLGDRTCFRIRLPRYNQNSR